MYLCTYQAVLEREPDPDKNKAIWFDDLDYAPLWAMPFNSTKDVIAESICTAVNVPLFFIVFETDNFHRIDKVRYYQRLARGDKRESITDLIDDSLDDMHSEIIVHPDELMKDARFVASIPMVSMYADGKAQYKDISPQFANVSPEAESYILRAIRSVDVFNFSSAWDQLQSKEINLPGTPDFAAKMFRGKSIFELTFLPLICTTFFDQTDHNQALYMCSRNLKEIIRTYNEFTLWSEGECDPETYDRLFTRIRNLIIDDENILDIVAGDAKKPSVNDLCPCGSGKKWKKCHGIYW